MSRVFVTVGTTEFEKLIQTMTSDQVLRTLRSRNYHELVLQVGTGVTLPREGVLHGVHVRAFRSKPSIAEDIRWADLIIGHAGAGTCLETLRAHKPLVVVTNLELMDNHQSELADRLAADGHLVQCTCDTLGQTLATMELGRLRPLPAGDAAPLARYLERQLGFS